MSLLVASAPVGSHFGHWSHRSLRVFILLVSTISYFVSKTINFEKTALSKRLLLFQITIYITLVDWNGRCETPAGCAGQMRPHRSFATRRLIACPAERSHLEWKSTTWLNSRNLYENNLYFKDRHSGREICLTI
ncbi:hypothetical protein SAMN05216565_110113 [Litchfieldia salsa]|uniref:Uncharacterized protein n=1 Tax=Litchfieldia salsa TaxID=930152 RepID=A0A1H0WD13_9BACI|nr:hypothetical protein SAMN05216565_110113 [Litchfieldia salsa]